MVKSLKSLNSRKRLPPKYGYVVLERGILYTNLGDPIIFAEPHKYVCGGCMLALRYLGCRSWLPSPSLETLPMLHTQTIPYATSKCGCAVNFLVRNPSLFLNSPLEVESTFMGFSLTCHCISEIRAKVNADFKTGRNAKREPWLPFGERVSLMSSKLTVLQHWQVIWPNTSPNAVEK